MESVGKCGINNKTHRHNKSVCLSLFWKRKMNTTTLSPSPSPTTFASPRLSKTFSNILVPSSSKPISIQLPSCNKRGFRTNGLRCNNTFFPGGPPSGKLFCFLSLSLSLMLVLMLIIYVFFNCMKKVVNIKLFVFFIVNVVSSS